MSKEYPRVEIGDPIIFHRLEGDTPHASPALVTKVHEDGYIDLIYFRFQQTHRFQESIPYGENPRPHQGWWELSALRKRVDALEALTGLDTLALERLMREITRRGGGS